MHPSDLLPGLALLASLGSSQSAPALPPAYSFTAVKNVLAASFQNGTVSVLPGSHFGENVPVGLQVGLSHPIDGDTSIPASAANLSTPSGSILGTQNYVLFMIDVDAPMPQNASESPLLHYFQGNLRLTRHDPSPYSLVANNTTDALEIQYIRPQPGAKSDPHEYNLYLFRQPPHFAVPQAFANVFKTRKNFDIAAFAKATNLGDPIAASYFFVSQQPSVPANFKGGPTKDFPTTTNTTTSSSATSASATTSSGSGSATATKQPTNSAGHVAACELKIGAATAALLAIMVTWA